MSPYIVDKGADSTRKQANYHLYFLKHWQRKKKNPKNRVLGEPGAGHAEKKTKAQVSDYFLEIPKNP